MRVPASTNHSKRHGTPSRVLWRLTIPPIDKRSAKSFIRTNERIRAREVRVIDENGEQLGVMVPFEALKMARERSLGSGGDLSKCRSARLQDPGLRKVPVRKGQERPSRPQKAEGHLIKEVKFSVTVDEHDYQTKKNQAVRFLGEGDKVKASIAFQRASDGASGPRVQDHQSADSGHRRCWTGGVHAADGRYDTYTRSLRRRRRRSHLSKSLLPRQKRAPSRRTGECPHRRCRERSGLCCRSLVRVILQEGRVALMRAIEQAPWKLVTLHRKALPH